MEEQHSCKVTGAGSNPVSGSMSEENEESKEEVKKDYVGSSVWWLLKDALEYARLKQFGGYINEHGGLDMVHWDQKKDHEELLLDRLGSAAVSYLHSLTVTGTLSASIRAEVEKLREDPAP